ncbi:MAG: alcohol dehydrogenase [Litorilinea sp.]|nr:MAG: alcohol dehydrogenase [Litorilinea sp.]GIV80477.1 MAG: alcohol dehydrogenase [Litorilinea sp.]
MNFEFATAARILFGPGVLEAGIDAAAGLGARALVVTGRHTERAIPLLDGLQARGVESQVFPISGEPDVRQVQEGVAEARRFKAAFVVGMGGGSAIDAGKAIAALLTNPGDPLDYLEVVGRGQPLQEPSAPFVAIPTTAGTGAEVTRNAVLAVPAERVKVSLRSPHMLPRLAVVDPMLTLSLPPAVTASTGLDALTQCLEPFVSIQANPLTDAIARLGLQRAARSLRRAYSHGEDASAREDMALASLCGGLALANARLGAVHGLAGVLGGMFPIPHGVICARLLPLVMEVNLRALAQRQPDSPIRARYDEVARILTGNPAADAADGVAWVEALCADLQVPSLGAPNWTPGLGVADIPAVVEKAQRSSSMKGNPLPLTDEELAEILSRAL